MNIGTDIDVDRLMVVGENCWLEQGGGWPAGARTMGARTAAAVLKCAARAHEQEHHAAAERRRAAKRDHGRHGSDALATTTRASSSGRGTLLHNVAALVSKPADGETLIGPESRGTHGESGGREGGPLGRGATTRL